VVCLSDTHCRTLPEEKIPGGDLLVHCGDLTETGTREEIQAQVDWLRGMPHRWKVVVGGNHDVWLDPSLRGAVLDDGEKRVANGEKTAEEVDWTGIEYLCDRAVELEFEGGRRLNVYGWGAVPWCGEQFA
jgi:3',5'-cyclic AMP phosphodiesterase CpdA